MKEKSRAFTAAIANRKIVTEGAAMVLVPGHGQSIP
jgi:hypothetical protein